MGGITIFVKKELPALKHGAMTYMMSKEAYLTDDADHNMAHLMFYTPLMNGAVWGAGLPNSPVMLNPLFKGAPEPIDKRNDATPGGTHEPSEIRRSCSIEVRVGFCLRTGLADAGAGEQNTLSQHGPTRDG
jgi:hypothetical protein